MLRRIALADVALVAALLLLALATANELEAFGDAHQQKLDDRAAFVRYVRGWSGRFGRVEVSLRRRIDVACALDHERRARRQALLCVRLRPRTGRVLAAYAAPLQGDRRRHYRCVGPDRCPPYLAPRRRASRG